MARLGLNQLVELGITLVGHQKKINNSIQVNGPCDLDTMDTVDTSHLFYKGTILRVRVKILLLFQAIFCQ